ncbi:MAG: hypothetical protein HQK79_10120 [Desulfobacterales bacterium]|nr:hypothetical protein [Desulfobacterales bacterium]
MNNHWIVINDDELKLTNKVVEFLQGEFCPPDSDPMWSVEYFRWKLGQINPAGAGYISIAILNDKVVGTVSLTKKRLLINGEELIGGEVGDTYSSSSIRHKCRALELSQKDNDPNSYINKSIFGRLASDVRERAEANGISFIYGTPNNNAYPGWVNKLGYFDSKKFQIESFSRPSAKVVIKKYPSLKIFSPVLKKAEKFSVSLQKHIYSSILCKKFTFEPCIPSSEELDKLWIRLKPINGFSLVRDSSYWNHRYLGNPIAKYSFFIIREKKHIAGVVVTRFFLAGEGRRSVYIAEWMKDDKIPMYYLLSEVVNYYRDFDVEVFNFWCDKYVRARGYFSRNMFFFRQRVPIIIADTSFGRLTQNMDGNINFYRGTSDTV